MLTKSNYLKYLQCRKALWLYKFRPELMSEVDDNTQRVFDTGYDVEVWAYKMFPDGVNTSDDISQSITETKKLMQDKTPVIFQATVSGDELFCRADIIVYDDKNDAWDIIEVKSSSCAKNIHIDDLAFQKICFENLGFHVGNLSVIHINGQYVRNGDIVADELLTQTDVTEKVEAKIEQTKIDIQNALDVLKEEKEPEVRILRQCANPYICPFIEYCWKDFSDHSIYSIGGALGASRIDNLLDMCVTDVADIPEELITTEKLSKHCRAVRDNEVCIDKENIQKELKQINYPIYYLDYETFGPAIPVMDGYRPFQRVIFQYSLHIQQSPDAELEHYDFLAKELEDPSKEMAQSLRERIGDNGTVIAWHMGFEKGCNSEIGERALEFKEFFEDVNDRMYDLMNVFKKGYYVHKDFYTSASLKKVLPVVVPELDYGILDIGEGMAASNSWGDMITKDLSQKEKDKIYDDLLKYCELDTLAMVKILEKLREI